MAVHPAGSGFGLPEGRPVDLPGRGVTFIREVGGPPGAPAVILLHGWTATGGLNWHPVMPSLGRRYRVIAPDLRGHGRGIVSRPFRLVDCADDVAALIAALGVERVILAGYSMGGPVAMLTWRRHPGLVDGLVLCATAATFSGAAQATPLFYGLLAGLRLTPIPRLGGVVRRVMSAVAPPVWSDTAEIRGHDARALIEGGIELGRFSARGWLGDIDVPTAVVVTTDDHLVPVADQRHLAAALPGASVHEVAGNHFVCVGQPRLFVRALVAACADVAARAGRSRSPRRRQAQARPASCSIGIWGVGGERSIA
jgi:pimeloyl-ACP methyl ester carboxylesterase